jgi:hypothetical protein
MRTLPAWLVVASLALASDLSAQDAAPAKHLLRYKFAKGEEIHWSTLHQGAWTTKIKGHEQKSTSTSKSTKTWKITDLSAAEHISFEHSLGHVQMTRQVGDRAPEHYDSKADPKPPQGYETVAATVGQTITEAVIDNRGNVIERHDKFPKFNLAVGDLVTPLPEEAIAIGGEWYAPDEVKLPVKGGIKVVKLRRAFRLENVAAGLATIKFTTQVLTPVNDPHAEAQLIQHVTQGVIKFDIDAGRVLSRQLDWRDTVLGFEGPESSMNYLARFTEELLPATPRAAAAGAKGVK